MKRFDVVIRGAVSEEIASHHAYMSAEAGIDIADRYIEQIRGRCEKLTFMPHRGTCRDDLSPGVRTISIKRSATVAYVVTDKQVIILHVAFRGQDLARLFE